MTEELYAEVQKRIDASIKKSDDAYKSACHNLGVSSSVFDILYELMLYGEGCSQKDLCDLCLTSKQTINSAIHKMEREGYVRLEQGQGRSTLVYLTDAGRELQQRIAAPVLAAERETFQAVDEGRLLQLVDLFEEYTDLLYARVSVVEEGGQR